MNDSLIKTLRTFARPAITTTIILIIFVFIFAGFLYFVFMTAFEGGEGRSEMGLAVRLDPLVFEHPFFASAQDFRSSAANAKPFRYLDPASPAPPEGLTAEPSLDGSTVVIRWDFESLPAGWQVAILRRVEEKTEQEKTEQGHDAEGLEIGLAPAESGTLVDENPPLGIGLSYTAQAISSSGVRSPASSPVLIAVRDLVPPPPPEVKLSSEELAVVITWDKPLAEDFSHVKVYRSEDAGLLGSVAADNIKETNYRDTAVVSGRTYYYTVVSVDLSGNESVISSSLGKPGKRDPFQKGVTVLQPESAL